MPAKLTLDLSGLRVESFTAEPARAGPAVHLRTACTCSALPFPGTGDAPDPTCYCC